MEPPAPVSSGPANGIGPRGLRRDGAAPSQYRWGALFSLVKRIGRQRGNGRRPWDKSPIETGPCQLTAGIFPPVLISAKGLRPWWRPSLQLRIGRSPAPNAGNGRKRRQGTAQARPPLATELSPGTNCAVMGRRRKAGPTFSPIFRRSPSFPTIASRPLEMGRAPVFAVKQMSLQPLLGLRGGIPKTVPARLRGGGRVGFFGRPGTPRTTLIRNARPAGRPDDRRAGGRP